MRRAIVGVCLALWSTSLARAQSTTTTVAATSSTSIPTSTSTTTTTSSSRYDSRGCASATTTKEDCRETCCTDVFDAFVGACDGDACGSDWDSFVSNWDTAGKFYKYCQNPEDPTVDAEFDVEQIGQKFVEFNVDDSCQPYRFGCKKAALKHVRQCADAGRCIGCCRTVLHRWRAGLARDVQAPGGVPACRKAVKCLRRATRQGEACRNGCRRKATCGEDDFKHCLEAKPGGREVLDCYGKCTEKCENADSYHWCLQACQGLDQCNAYEECSTFLETGDKPSGCLTKAPSDCVTVTTTSTSTSSSTSSTVKTTTTSTSSTSPLLVAPQIRSAA